MSMNKTLNDQFDEQQNVPQPLNQPTESELPQLPVSLSDTSSTLSQKHFKQLNTEALLEIEQNQYSESTKKNTKWGTRVFNGTYL